MKNIIILLVISTTIANAQIFTQNAAGGSITITPNGVQGSTNSGTVNTNVGKPNGYGRRASRR